MGPSEILSEEEWLSAVQKKLGTQDCQVLEVSVDKLGGDVSGFLGEHLQAKVSVLLTKSKPSVRRELCFFIKRIPVDHPQHTELVVSSQSFDKETRLYSHVFERLPLSESPWAPECYLVRPDLLVMEDLCEKGFKIAGRLNHLNFTQCKLVLRALASFHAAAMVLEEREPTGKKLNEMFPDTLYENIFTENHTSQFRFWFRGATTTLKCAVGLLPKYKGEEKKAEELGNKLTKYMQQMFDLVKPSTKYRNVICHGDMWTNNVLFKYDGETPIDVRIVDFQLARYSPPALDVMSFLHLNTSRPFRSTHSSKLLSAYHGSLSEHLSRHGYDVEHFLPWAQFLESCEVYRPFGLIIAPTYHHTDMMPQEALQGFLDDPDQFGKLMLENRFEKVAFCCKINERYRDRIFSELGELLEYVERFEEK